ncbi:MAG TPA: PilZ domain-containing protein [Candidatus Polarisedimenticolaceae bacterium]|nr:PilZ domain-containing protein [Candidatus Polarisedimenticolaceae bacterium]
MGESGFDRRRHPRVETRIQVNGSPEDGAVVARMVTDNLSLAGLQCTSSADFPEMTRLAVRLMLPPIRGGGNEVEPVDVEAVVVRRTDLAASSGDARYRLALFFTRIDDRSKERLVSFLEARKRGAVVSS